ncbi:SMP-30/gluconolactonase/LRE family protein [Bordetella genomosp. 9]|nr:L-dopachrome tautomerase-related protein [Bordetella genomosp. 9]
MTLAKALTGIARIASACLAIAIIQGCATHQESNEALVPMFQGQRVWNGVTTTPEGRVFVSYPQADGAGMQVAELDAQGRPYPFPDATWNAPQDWSAGTVGSGFVHVNALRIGPDGNLWIVDAGAPGLGKPAVKGGARLFRFEPQSRRLIQTFDLASAVHPYSYIDDIRFNGRFIYITDAGAPGLIVLDTQSGTVRRVLDGNRSVVASRPLRADGRAVTDAKGQPLRVHADQLEVSPDGQWLYFQPASGPMARIATRWLNDPTVSEKEIESHVELAWADTPSTGGTAIDANGNLYVTDTDKRRILRVSPEGKISTLIQDDRLIWADALWIDREGYLWIPASQQNLTPEFNGGRMAVQYPVWIYRLQIHAQPSPRDHS